MDKGKRRWMVVLGALVVVAIAFAAAFQLALRRLHGGVEAALGPRATLESVSLHWNGVELHGLRVRAVPGQWPAADELSATRVTVVPALSSLWRSGWRVASITVDGGSLSLLRTRDGRLRLLPSLLEGARNGKTEATSVQRAVNSVHVGALRLRNATIDFHDATVAGARGAPHRIRLAALDADAGPLALPGLNERLDVSMQATLVGPNRNGTLSLQGQLTPSTRDAELAVKVRGLDMVALQPYLLRSNEAAVKRGTLDLAIDARVKAQRLAAPGRLTIADLELAGGGALGTFAGVPRQAVLAAMSRDGRIELAFTLEGRLDEPKFSLNELFAARFAVGLAEKLGVSVGGVVEGLGSVIKGLFGR